MPKNYHPLPTMHLNAGSPYYHTGDLPELIHLEDPALSVMVDFKHTRAITIAPTAFIAEAGIEMKACSVHLLLVVDNEGRVVGLISSEDILGEKPVKITQEKHLSRAEIRVRLVMTPQEHIVAIDYETLRLAKVAHVVQTLKAAKQHYALVVETNHGTHQQTVRGLFSLSQISKQLTVNVIDDDPLARSLIELRHKIGD
jgi:CBS domain containing-hemolysin-like protein